MKEDDDINYISCGNKYELTNRHQDQNLEMWQLI